MIVANNLSGLTEVYLGNESIAQVYYGSHLVWPQDPVYGMKILLTNDEEETANYDCGHKGKIDYNTAYTYDDSSVLARSEIYDLSQSLGETVTAATIGDCVHTIEAGCFDWRNGTNPFPTLIANTLKRVTIGSGVTEIKGSVFYRCSAMTNCELSVNTETIGEYAFQGCARLRNITFPSALREIKTKAFYGCSSLDTISFANGLETIGEGAFEFCSMNRSINMPNTVTSMGASAFCTNSYATTINISTGLTEIAASAFKQCVNNKSIDIPNNVKRVKASAFENNYAASAITIGTKCMYIEGNAFYNCSGATTATMGDKVVEIGASAFEECSSLQTIRLSETLDKVGDRCFCGCNSLREIVFPDSVYELGSTLFYQNYSVTAITIGSGVRIISGNYGIFGCTSFTCKATTPPTLNGSLSFRNGSDYKIFVPSESVEDYKNASRWSNYADHIYPISE